MFFLAVFFVSFTWATSLLAEERLPLRPEACLMPPPEGDCGGAQQNRWFFDAGTGSCRQFLFLGCHGIGINFETLEECDRICVHAAAGDDLEPQPEVQGSAGILSTFPVDPAESDQHNAERTTAGLLGTIEETKDTIGRVTPDMTSPPPLSPSGIQKKLSGSAEEVTRVAETPNKRASDKTTQPLAPEKDQEDEKNTSVRVKDFDEGPRTSLLIPELPHEPLAINDQPLIPSNLDSGNAEGDRDSVTPLVAIESQPEPPSFEEQTPDDDQENVAERSKPLTDQDDDDDDDRNTEEPVAGSQDPDSQTELEHEAEQVRPKEATNEEENREDDPNANLFSGTPRMMPSNGEVGITHVPTTSMLSNGEELQRNITPKLASDLGGNAEMERVQQEDSDRKEPQDDMREMSTVKKTEQTTRNQEDTEHRRVDHQAIAEKSQPEVIEITTVRTVPIEPSRSGLGVPVTRSPARMKSPLGSRRTGSDGLSQDDSKPEDHATAKEGKRNIGVAHQIPEALPLLKSLPHLASGEESKAPRTIATNSSHRGADSRNAAQPPAANGPPAATPFSLDGKIKHRESPSTGDNSRIANGNLGVRTKADVPAMRLLKSETDYRRPTFCSLHKVRGHCTEHLHRWFFNPFNGSCQSFTYSGCGGNPNNFETMDACFETCTGRNSDRSRRLSNFQEDAPNLRVPTRFGEPNWLPVSASLAGPPAPQSAGLQLFLDILRRKLPTPASPPSFLRSLAFPLIRFGGGPGDNVAEQKMLHRDSDVEESGKPEEQQHRAKQSIESSEKRSHLMGKASGSEQHEKMQIQNEQQPMKTQRSRSSEELRASSNQPELSMVESDVATLRHLLQHDPRESRDSVFNPLGRYPETSSAQKSRYPDARKADDTRTNRRVEMEQTRYDDRLPVVQRARSRQNRQSPAIGFQRFGHFVNNNGRPIPPELKNFQWIEQAIVMSDLAPTRFNLPFWFGDEMMGKGRPLSHTVSNWRGFTRLKPDSENPQNALTLRRNPMILESRQHPEKLQDDETERRLAGRASYSANALVPHAMKPSRMEISLDRGLPRQSLKQRQSSFPTSPSDSFPARGKWNVEIPFHVLRLTRPLMEQTAGRTGVGRVEQDSRRFSHTDADGRRNGGIDDVRAERPDVVGGRDESHQEQVKERTVQRRRNNNGFSNRFPNDRLTFLQIFVNRDEVGPANQPHFPSPSREENQYLNRQGLSLSRSQIDRPRFQAGQNNGYLPPPPPPPPRQISPRQRPVQISRETMTEERDWLPASEFDGLRPNGEYVNSRSGSFGSVPIEDPKDTRGTSIHFVCQLPLEPGSCAGYQAKWYYNQRTGSCELFYYGGCAGNGNRFDTRDDCLQTCDGGSNLKTDETGESRSLGGTFGPQPSEISSEDDVIVLTSPVYGGEFEENVKDFATVKAKYAGHDHVIRPLMTTHAPFLSGHGKRGELESNAPLDVEIESKAGEGTTIANAPGKSAITESTGKGGDAGAKKDEDLSKTFSTQYIAIVTALGVVGIAVVLMIILSIVRLCRRVKKSKREHCIQEVIKSHMYGDLPHVLYSESPSSVVSEKEKSDQK